MKVDFKFKRIVYKTVLIICLIFQAPKISYADTQETLGYLENDNTSDLGLVAEGLSYSNVETFDFDFLDKDVFLCGIKITSVSILVYNICQMQLSAASAVCSGTAGTACIPALTLASGACGYELKLLIDFINNGACR